MPFEVVGWVGSWNHVLDGCVDFLRERGYIFGRGVWRLIELRFDVPFDTKYVILET